MYSYAKIICYNSGESDMPAHTLTIYGIREEKVKLELDESCYSLISARFARRFGHISRRSEILDLIARAKDYTELEELAVKYDICDVCDFSEINFLGVKSFLEVIVKALCEYPALRSRLCYTGSHSGYEKLITALKNGDESVLDKFNLPFIRGLECAERLGNLTYNILSDLMRRHKSYIATAFCAFGCFDAVLLDQHNYDGEEYYKLLEILQKSEERRFNPVGSSDPASVVWHEIGHLLDEASGLSCSVKFKRYSKQLSRKKIKDGLSAYAAVSDKELIAEAFSEYKCNPAPRAIAKTVGEMLDKAYKEKRKK